MHGFLMKVRRFGAGGVELREKSDLMPAAVDIQCVNSSGSDLVGSEAGGDWVDLDLANFQDKMLPRVLKAADTLGTALGVVHWGEGTIADGKQLWVRIYGRHLFAKVDVTTPFTYGALLGAFTTAGVAKVVTTIGSRWGRSLFDSVTGSQKLVLIENPSGILAL